MKKEKIIIGSRGSKLAMIQSNWVKSELEKKNPGLEVVIKEISTKGDKITDVPLSRLGGVGLFTKELENCLLSNEIDIAVHSAKDMPAELPEGLMLGAITEREDSHDVLISRDNVTLEQLSDKAVVGTSSLRRRAQLFAKMPDLVIKDLRGNLDTRLKRVESGDYDAIILAHAGLVRMGLDDLKRQVISFDCMIPAVGQGALGIEIRQDDEVAAGLVQLLNHESTCKSVTAERSLLATLRGGCQTPVGAIGEVSGSRLKLEAMVSSLDGKQIIRDCMESDVEDAVATGIKLAEKLMAEGADTILQDIRDNFKPIK